MLGHGSKHCAYWNDHPLSTEIEVLKQLPALSAASKERPDLKSSPKLWNERKAILGAANMVHLLRNTSYSVQKFTSFAFPMPNIDDSHCIAEIQVTWENLMFASKLTRYTNPLDAIERSKEVIA